MSEVAIQEFFTENNMEYKKDEIEAIHGSLYKNMDERLRLYCCDLYDFSSEFESGLQAVWDRGSIIAVNKEDRRKYIEVLRSVCAENARYLVEIFHYDKTKYNGPPHCLDGGYCFSIQIIVKVII